MYRAILVDDEVKILDLIKQLGHFDELSIEIIDECRDGESALKSICENKPDFVISDIKMPVYDGIELIEKTREAGLDPYFVLLSGYRLFEYARSAIALNVVDYLLKPVDEEQLNKVLISVCKKVDEKKNTSEDLSELNAIRDARAIEKRNEFWRELTDVNALANFKYSREYISRTYDIDFKKELFKVVYVGTNLDVRLMGKDSIFGKKMRGFLAACFGDVADYEFISRYTGTIIILNYDKDNENEVKKGIEALFYNVRDMQDIYGDFRMNIGVSLEKNKAEDLARANLEGFWAEWGRIIFLGNSIIDFKQVEGLCSFSPEDLLPDQKLVQIRECLRNLRKEELAAVFSEIYEKAANYKNSSVVNMTESYERIVLSFIEEFPEDKRAQIRYDLFFTYLEARNFQGIFKNMYIYLAKYIDGRKEELSVKKSRPINEAISFIRDNFSKDISLEDTAGAANVSPAYLSSIFKEKMGMGYSDYLTDVRLDRAKKLLTDSSISIKELAGQVGYNDEKYFSKTFKKKVGIKPTDYRRLYG